MSNQQLDITELDINLVCKVYSIVSIKIAGNEFNLVCNNWDVIISFWDENTLR